MISVWFLTYVREAFRVGLFLDLLSVSRAEMNRVVQVKYTNFIIPFWNDGKVNFNDFWSRKKAYVNQRRLSVKSDFFWIRSSAKRAFGGCLGSKRR